jgi:uncharacterized membrane protein YbhN (UPF0104 family)
MRARTLALFALKLAVSAGALYYVTRQIDFATLVDHFPSPWSWQVFAAEACFLAALLISVFRWRLILRWQGHDLPFRPLWAITWISNFFSLLLPGGIGRDISRGVYLARFRIGALEIARSILTDRFIGLVSVVVLSVPCMIFALQSGGALHVMGWVLLLFCVGLPVGLWLCHWLDRRYYGHKTAAGESRIERVVHAVAAILRDFRSPRLFGIPFLQSCAMMAATTLCVMAISGAIGGFAAPLWSQPLFLPVIFLLSQLPISIAGIGVREAAFVSFFGAVGATAEQALALSLAFFTLGVVNNLVGGLVYLAFGRQQTA